MNDVSVDSARMHRAVQRAQEKLEQVRNQTESLRTNVDELNATWTGGNHDEFVEDFKRHYELMVTLSENVERFLDGIEKSASAYDSCDAELKEIAKGVKA